MNTYPDDTRLALWLDDELDGEELAAFEKWAAQDPALLASREDARRWRAMIADAMPREEEPPYPEFFNHRLEKSIRELQPVSMPDSRPRITLRSWLMPLTACAAVVLAFWLGGRKAGTYEIDVSGAPRAIPVEPIIYTPEKGVQAEWFDSTGALATVIVLDGVSAIPDNTDFSRTVYLNRGREIDSTARLSDESPAFEP
jgi:hypothetical protein